LVNSRNENGAVEIKSINVDQLAKDFAEIKNTMTIILFIACRDRSSENYAQYEKRLPALSYEGVSIIFYSSELCFQS
jgi:hypothetical protein